MEARSQSVTGTVGREKCFRIEFSLSSLYIVHRDKAVPPLKVRFQRRLHQYEKGIFFSFCMILQTLNYFHERFPFSNCGNRKAVLKLILRNGLEWIKGVKILNNSRYDL